MAFSGKLTVPEAVKNILAAHGLSRIADICRWLDKDHDIFVSSSSLRVRLSTMAAKGEIVRHAFGSYCLPGREPPKVDLAAWVAGELKRAWPAAHDSATLRKEFLRQNNYRLPFEHFDHELVALNSRGLARHLGRGCYSWDRDAPASQDIFAD